MEKGYFAAAWGDITKSPGWFSKILRMGLLNLVPFFGVIVSNGYLYGWARDIAWNVHRPMPAKIFGNEDGKLYKRGFFILVIGIVLALIPSFIQACSDIFLGGSSAVYGNRGPALGVVFLKFLFVALLLAASVAAVFFGWVGFMRTSLYGTLSAGFQFSKIWAMLRYDFKGLLRIFGMYLIAACIVGFLVFVSIFLFAATFALIAYGMLYSLHGASDAMATFGLFGTLLLLIFAVAFMLVGAFGAAMTQALVARALGYWTRQFQVGQWGGQEDPMPFELQQAAQPAAQPQQPYQAVPSPSAQEQPVQQHERQMNFDPQTGKPIAQSNFDSQTGDFVGQADFNPQAGVPVQQAPCQIGQQPVAQSAPFRGDGEAVVRPAAEEPCADRVDSAVEGFDRVSSGESESKEKLGNAPADGEEPKHA
jgi:hypothetical protein